MPELREGGLAAGAAIQWLRSSPWIRRWFRCWRGRAPGASPTSTPRPTAAEPHRIGSSSRTSEAGWPVTLFALNCAMKPSQEPRRRQTAASAGEPGLAADLVLLRLASFTVKMVEMSHLVKKKKVCCRLEVHLPPSPRPGRAANAAVTPCPDGFPFSGAGGERRAALPGLEFGAGGGSCAPLLAPLLPERAQAVLV